MTRGFWGYFCRVYPPTRQALPRKTLMAHGLGEAPRGMELALP